MNNSYETANTYRLHQDTLRWNLFAGCIALLVGVGGFSEKFAAAPELFGIALALLGNLLLVVLAVESFYYNLYAAYLGYCDEYFTDPSKRPSFQKFTTEHSERISPNHYSFSLAMFVVVVGNAAIIGIACDYRVTRYCFHPIGPMLYWIICYRWQKYAYPILERVFPKPRIPGPQKA